jgi:hypothetical protein
MRTSVLIGGLVLLLVANFIMMYYAPYGLSAMEGFKESRVAPAKRVASKGETRAAPKQRTPSRGETRMAPKKEGFQAYSLSEAGGAKDAYEPIGAYDGVKLSTGNNVSGWRYTAPNEPLLTGSEFVPGPDSLFIFKNNQCKPECCGASFSCGGGCVCTTPEQRQYIAGRGGNRTAPEDSA